MSLDGIAPNPPANVSIKSIGWIKLGGKMGEGSLTSKELLR